MAKKDKKGVPGVDPVPGMEEKRVGEGTVLKPRSMGGKEKAPAAPAMTPPAASAGQGTDRLQRRLMRGQIADTEAAARHSEAAVDAELARMKITGKRRVGTRDRRYAQVYERSLAGGRGGPGSGSGPGGGLRTGSVQGAGSGLRMRSPDEVADRISQVQTANARIAAMPGQTAQRWRDGSRIGAPAPKGTPGSAYENFGGGIEIDTAKGGWRGLGEREKRAAATQGTAQWMQKQGLKPAGSGEIASMWTGAGGAPKLSSGARKASLALGSQWLAGQLRGRNPNPAPAARPMTMAQASSESNYQGAMARFKQSNPGIGPKPPTAVAGVPAGATRSLADRYRDKQRQRRPS